MATITDLKNAETNVDNALAEISAKTAANIQSGKMGAGDPFLDVALIVQGTIAILKGAEILLWWKPSWKTAIDGGIAFLETFLIPDVPAVPAETPVNKTAAFYNPNGVSPIGE